MHSVVTLLTRQSIKAAAPIIAPAITHVINLSLGTTHVPAKMETRKSNTDIEREIH